MTHVAPRTGLLTAAAWLSACVSTPVTAQQYVGTTASPIGLPTPGATNTSSSSSQYVEIPSSTIISIGLGFLAMGLGVLSLLLLFRLRRLRKLARQQGRTVRDLWRTEGGFWGFLTSLGGGGAEAEMIGAGGRGWGMRVIRLTGGDAGQAPEMWEADWYDPDAKERSDQEWAPLAVSTSPPPLTSYDKKSLPLPMVNISVLISMPSSTTWDPVTCSEELPELVIGSSTILPVREQSLTDDEDKRSVDEMEGGLAKAKGEITQIEYASDVSSFKAGLSRRVEWTKDDSGQWTIDGL
ncbi:hypothetical protein IAU60_004293 [Kwoniella sp. DSM 27419]